MTPISPPALLSLQFLAVKKCELLRRSDIGQRYRKAFRESLSEDKYSLATKMQHTVGCEAGGTLWKLEQLWLTMKAPGRKPSRALLIANSPCRTLKLS